MKGFRYEADGKPFDSAYEIAFYVYYTAMGKNVYRNSKTYWFTYSANGKTHKYYPDFLIDGTFYEVKGSHFFRDGIFVDPYAKVDRQAESDAKLQCMIDHHVILEDALSLEPAFKYMEKQYGKEWAKFFMTPTKKSLKERLR